MSGRGGRGGRGGAVPMCKFYQQGNCRRGDSCNFSHGQAARSQQAGGSGGFGGDGGPISSGFAMLADSSSGFGTPMSGGGFGGGFGASGLAAPQSAGGFGFQATPAGGGFSGGNFGVPASGGGFGASGLAAPQSAGGFGFQATPAGGGFGRAPAGGTRGGSSRVDPFAAASAAALESSLLGMEDGGAAAFGASTQLRDSASSSSGYSDISDMDMLAFQAQAFGFGKIPLVAPPLEFR